MIKYYNYIIYVVFFYQNYLYTKKGIYNLFIKLSFGSLNILSTDSYQRIR